MTVTDAETTDESATVALGEYSDLVPNDVTVDIERLREDVVHLEHNGLTIVLEGAGPAVELTAVYDAAGAAIGTPARVPDWIPAVAGMVGIEEVSLGR